MSSNGTAELERQFSQASADLTEQNYWLCISIARLPLAVLYRATGNELKVTPPVKNSLPDKYPSVRFSDLRNFIESASVSTLKRYFPEAGTGTRALLDKENKGPINWPGAEQVPGYIEELTGNFPFIEIVSYPQLSRETTKAASCSQLRQMGINGAVICANSDKCDHLILADYVLAIKVLPNFGAGSNQYLISNAAECEIAQALAPHEIVNCKLFGDPQNHIVRVDATQSSSSNFLGYLECGAPVSSAVMQDSETQLGLTTLSSAADAPHPAH
jgi:hypothetical protein